MADANADTHRIEYTFLTKAIRISMVASETTPPNYKFSQECALPLPRSTHLEIIRDIILATSWSPEKSSLIGGGSRFVDVGWRGL